MSLTMSGPGLLTIAVVAVASLTLGACTTSPISSPPVVEASAVAGSDTVSPLQIPTPAGTFDAITAGPRTGRKVMLLHGFAELGREWEHQVAALGAAGYHAVAPDQRGYSPGVRPAPVEDYALDRLVEDVFAMADALGWERFDLVGHDWGAVVGWMAAAGGPERVRSYTAVSVPHVGAFADALRNDPQQQRMSVYMDQFRQPPDGPERALLASGPPNLPGVAREKSEYYYARLSEPGALTAALNWYRANRFDGQYAPVEVPTLLIVGTEDELVAPSGITATADWVTGPYRLERLDGVGHFAPEEAPQKVTTLLLDHLLRHASAAQPASSHGDADDLVAALARDAHALRSTEPDGDLRDLRPLGAMVADATVVGLGEATHSSREFVTMKHRVFRYLVEEQGFTTFSLETGWSGGVRLNEYVRHGTGDLDQIMKDEFQGSYQFWRTAEYRDLIEWMRAYNSEHATQVQFMGNDLGYVGPELFDRVTAYVRAHHPTLVAQFIEAYRDLRPTTDASTWMSTYPGLPVAQRQAVATMAQRALDALAATHDTSEEFTWTVQHARAITQVATMYAFDSEDPARFRDAMLYRDQVMADNTVWWHEQTGAKILVSAHNGHVGYEPHEPEQYPRMQGAFLRDRLGAGYVSVGFTFHHGSFNAQDENDQLGTFAVGPVGVGNNEYVLDQVALRDYVLDMRSAPAGARAWLAEPRPTHSIGSGWPQPDRLIALGRTHDILIHLHRVQAAHLLG